MRRFWESPAGQGILTQLCNESNIMRVVPTHVTRRTALPDLLSLGHVDYPADYQFIELYREWQER